MSIIIKETARRIKEIRERKGLRAEEIAKMAGMHRATYYRYEAGDGKSMKLDKLRAIADALGVAPVDLVVWGDDEKPAPENEGELDSELIGMLIQLTPEETEKVSAFAQGLLAARKGEAFPHR